MELRNRYEAQGVRGFSFRGLRFARDDKDSQADPNAGDQSEHPEDQTP